MKLYPLVLAGLLVAAYADTAAAQTPLEIRDTQQRLQALGFYSGPIDGVMGRETQAALARYQQSRGTPFGGVDAARPVTTVPVVPPAAVAPPTRPVALTDAADIRIVQARLRQLGLYRGTADGVWGPDTQRAMEGFQRSRGLQVGQVDTATLSAMGLETSALRSTAALATRDPLDPGVVRAVQQRLRTAGVYTGGIDGVWGGDTERALAQFQRSREMEPSGRLTPATAAALGMDPNNLAASALPAQ